MRGKSKFSHCFLRRCRHEKIECERGGVKLMQPCRCVPRTVRLYSPAKGEGRQRPNLPRHRATEKAGFNHSET